MTCWYVEYQTAFIPPRERSGIPIVSYGALIPSVLGFETSAAQTL